jgi:hypothetical protein
MRPASALDPGDKFRLDLDRVLALADIPHRGPCDPCCHDLPRFGGAFLSGIVREPH